MFFLLFLFSFQKKIFVFSFLVLFFSFLIFFFLEQKERKEIIGKKTLTKFLLETKIKEIVNNFTSSKK